MFTRLFESLAATEELSRVFADDSVLQAMLDFEAALARAEARCGVIPAMRLRKSQKPRKHPIRQNELTRLSLRPERRRFRSFGMLKAKVEAVTPTPADSFTGRYSQDVVDTAIALLPRRCRIFDRDRKRVLPRYAVFPMSTQKPLCSPARCCRRPQLRSG
jgi:3-carboxy-cis,cis-muconate cycloisomerase